MADDNSELYVITTYFNSQNYVSRLRNLTRFLQEMQDVGVKVLVIECAFADQKFVLAPSEAVIQVRCPSILWQKERLLNLALERLPGSVAKVAWIDADVLLENPFWCQEASRELNDYPVIQLFDSVVRLPRSHTTYKGKGEVWRGFGATCVSPGCEQLGWHHHGHTGFAWAATRKLLDACGFFDLSLCGTGDHLMAHGFMGDWTSPCIEDLVGIGTPLYCKFRQWARIAARETSKRVSFIPGRALHLWHGATKNRQYNERSRQFKGLQFRPDLDIELTLEGCWVSTGLNPALEEWTVNMFVERNEDGKSKGRLKGTSCSRE
jgi:hypothetical protein